MSTSPLLIYEASGRGASREVSAVLDRLEATYLAAHKRKLPADMLSLSCGGDLKSPVYGIVAYHTPEQRAIVQFLQQTLST